MTGRETIAQKAARYVSEARISILKAGKYTVSARARGESEYAVTYNGRRWSCTCPARGNCCHQAAVKLVVAPKRRPRWRWFW